MGTSIRPDFLSGMGKQNEEFIMILDIGKVFSPGELSLPSEAEPLETDS